MIFYASVLILFIVSCCTSIWSANVLNFRAPETTQEASVQASADLKDDGSLQEEEPELTHQNLRWLFWNALSRFVVRLTAVVLRILELYLSSGLLLCIFIVAIQQVSVRRIGEWWSVCCCKSNTYVQNKRFWKLRNWQFCKRLSLEET